MNKREIVRRFFKKNGYRGKYNRQILKSITFRFDLFSKETEKIALYVVSRQNLFNDLVDAAGVIGSRKLDLKVCLCIPENFSLPLSEQKRASNYNVDLYIIKNRHVERLTKALSKREEQKLSIEEIKKIIGDINRICKAKWWMDLFKINNNLLNNLSHQAEDEEAFFYQISTISAILESVNLKEIKNFCKPRTKKERDFFAFKQSISIIELFLKKNKLKYDSSLLKIMRDLRDLRNLPPAHPSRKTKVYRKFIGRIPRVDDDWAELSQVTFSKFKTVLIQLRNVLK